MYQMTFVNKNTVVAIFTCFTIVIAPASILLVANNFFNLISVYGQQTNSTNSSTTTTYSHAFPDSIKTKKIVRAGDIDIAYKIFGKGNPILLINGYSQSMDDWDPILLEKLASNHTVIIFDNRGIGNTTSSEKRSPYRNLQMILLVYWMH
jgi:hypothetical protein